MNLFLCEVCSHPTNRVYVADVGSESVELCENCRLNYSRLKFVESKDAWDYQDELSEQAEEVTLPSRTGMIKVSN